MKKILFVVAVLIMAFVIMAPGRCPGGVCPTPVKTQPVETQPVETQPVETQPVETQPVETQPVETQPVESAEPTYVIDTQPPLPIDTPSPVKTKVVVDNDKFKNASLPKSGFGPQQQGDDTQQATIIAFVVAMLVVCFALIVLLRPLK